MKSLLSFLTLLLLICPAIAQTNKDSVNHPQQTQEQLAKPDDHITPAPAFSSHTNIGEPVKNADEPLTWVQVMPKFPGGDQKLLEYIQQHLHYPDSARIKKIQGRVTVRLIVGEDGIVRDASIPKGMGVGGGCDEEAVRTVMSLPKWNP